jgi:transketolase
MEKKTENVQAAIIDELHKMMVENEDIFIVGADLIFLYKAGGINFPDRMLDVGIAEQTMISMAAGLAYSGKTVFTSAIAEMTTARVAENIRLDCCYPNMNVNMFGQGRGLAYGFLGVTHQATEDIAMIRAIPNMTILLAADPREARKMVRAAAEYPGPTYIGLARGSIPIIPEEEWNVYDADYEFRIGKAVTIKDGGDVTLIATGDMVIKSIEAANLLEKEGIKARVLNMHTIKPLDEEAVIKAAHETGAIVTIEDHSILGGLGGAVAEVVVEHCPVPMKRVGVPDETTVIGEFDELIRKYKMDPPAIVDAVKGVLKRKK